MSRLFDRRVRVEIEADGELIQVGDVRTQFYSFKTRSDTPNELSVRLFNVSRETRLSAQRTGAVVRLFAGYGDNEVLIAQAETTRVLIERQPPDIILVLECLDGITALRDVRVSLSFERGATAGQVLDAISEQLGRPVRPIDVPLNVPMRGGYSHVGGVGTCLDDICRRVNARWSVQNGDLLVLGPDGRVPGEVVLLSPDSGLIRSPEPVEDLTSSERIDDEPRNGWRVTSLLQGQVEPGDQIRLESADVAGTFVVDDAEHRGDTHGQEFYTTLTVYE